jgi:putative Mg2+ transporter-C (MgtC) family protein
MSTLQTIWNTIVLEFSDIADAAQTTQVVVRLFVAALLGSLLGFERELRGKNAGVRTHMLVAIGSALFILVPQQAGASIEDLTGIVEGLVAGIGFLGAGAIISGGQKGTPSGLTTAANIWLTAAIGVSAGMGRETLAVLSTLIALTVLAVVPKLVGYLRRT